MKSNKEEEYYAADALNQIEPVAWIGIIQVIGPRFDGDEHPIDRVIDERYKDSPDFHKKDVRDRLQVFHCVVESSSTSDCL